MESLSSVSALPLIRSHQCWGTNQIDVGEGNGLLMVRNIVYTENALLAVGALAPKAKDFIAQVQGKLGGIGMKSRLLAA